MANLLNLPRLAVFLLSVSLLGEPPRVAAGDLCEPLNCRIGFASEECALENQACDMIRNLCVPACVDGDCCRGVACPAGAECVPWLGQCGHPAGPSCFDLGQTWWTGSKTQNPQSASPARTSMDFVVRNMSRRSLYFPVSSAQPRIRFDLYVQHCGARRKLNLPENQSCLNVCPATGPVQERDCDHPTPLAFKLRAGQAVRLTWSGFEAVTTYRSCISHSVRVCTTEQPTRAGDVIAEICAYSEENGGTDYKKGTGLLVGSNLVGPVTCLSKEFIYPAESEVWLSFVQ